MTARPPALTRRTALTLGGAAAATLALRPFAWAQGRSGLHALSVFGEFKYPADFKHFDHVRADAPKGGRLHFQPPSWAFNQSTQTFNTLNGFVLRGEAPPRIGLCFDSLMVSAADEPDTMYGLVAETVAVSEDGNVFTFTLRPEARFHDGSRLTADDVAFSFDLLKRDGHPTISQAIREMTGAEARDPATVVVTLSGNHDRSTILTVAGLPIFSRAYYEGRDFQAATLEAPLASGPYRVGRIAAPRFVEYERVADYWGRDLPVRVGTNNFDVVRIDFFRERQTAFEAFKKGDVTHREEFTAQTWATEYNFPAFTAGRVKKTAFDEEAVPDMQGFWFNTRRGKFADPRTREAIGLAFDFEWTNRNLFYGAYERQVSYFQKSEFMAEGAPGPEELALLEPFRADLPDAVYGTPYAPPESDGSGSDRALLRRATELLAEAGWQADGRRLVDASGQPLTIEFLINASVYERVLTPFVRNLQRVGIGATIRTVDPSQYQSRLDGFEFDVISSRFSMSATPLEEPRQFFGSDAAKINGSYNYAGISHPALDALIARLPKITDRAELVATLRAMDRVLRAQHYWIPNWYSAEHRVAHWDLFGWPAEKPPYGFAPEITWWLDGERAAAAGRPAG